MPDLVGPDIVSQGGSREPRPWRRWVAVATALALVSALAVQHFVFATHAKPVPVRPPGGVAAPVPAVAAEPDGILGPTLSWPAALRVPAAGSRPVWFSPDTGQARPIGDLPPQRASYIFVRIVGGWAIQQGPLMEGFCNGCAGPPRPVYVLRTGAPSVTWAGMADAVAPGATAGTLWLTSYPPEASIRVAAGTARQVSITGQPLGAAVTLPAGYQIERATGRGLLLTPVAPGPGPLTSKLWNPAAPAVSHTLTGVVAASVHEIAWVPPCAARCSVHLLNLTTGRNAEAGLPAGSSVANADFSPDGAYLALQVSFGNSEDDGASAVQLEMVTVATGRTAIVPHTWVSSDALVNFGWPASGDTLVAALSFTTRTQLLSWRPGASQVATTVVRQQSPASLAIGRYTP